MKVGIYARGNQLAATEALNGLAGLGHSCVRRQPGVYRRGEVEKFDLVLVVGFGGSAAQVASDYRGEKVPVIEMDVPSVHPLRPGSFWRLSLGGPHWLIPEGPTTLRSEALGLEPLFSPGRRGSSILICGQAAGDAAHDLSTGAAIVAWAEGIAKRCREQVDKPLVWRPHPADTSLRPQGFDAVSLGPLEDALATAHAVVTISSGAGLVALRRGVPVVATGPAVYGHLAQEIKHLPKLPPPSKDRVADLFARLAYQHWTRDELQSGAPMKIFMDLAFGRSVAWPQPIAPAPSTDKPSPAPKKRKPPARRRKR